MAAGPGLYSPPPYPYHALNYNAISSAFQPDPSASRLVVPECDYYFPSINQEYTVNNQVIFGLQLIYQVIEISPMLLLLIHNTLGILFLIYWLDNSELS